MNSAEPWLDRSAYPRHLTRAVHVSGGATPSDYRAKARAVECTARSTTPTGQGWTGTAVQAGANC